MTPPTTPPTNPAARSAEPSGGPTTRLWVPLAGLVAVVLVAVTALAAQSTPADQPHLATPDGTTMADVPQPPAPPVPRTELVPVRTPPAESEPPGPGEAVALRLLVVATDGADVELATWRSILDRVGTPYDVLLADEEPVLREGLVRPDDVGRYSAVLLTSAALLVEHDGEYTSALEPAEWETLWAYERDFGVRQVALNAAPGEYPEDYCLRAVDEGLIDDDPVELAITGEGRQVFDYLRGTAQVPLARSYLYQASIADGCAATPLLTVADGSAVVAVASTSADGRERAAVTFSLGPEELSAHLLGFGLLRWATDGVFLGERRHWLNVDVDDWFGTTLRVRSDGSHTDFRLSGADALGISEQQRSLRDRHALAAEFVLNLPYNGGAFDVSDASACDAPDPVDPLSARSRCLIDEFRWINHTYSHPEMNTTDYPTSYTEIRENLGVAETAKLPVPPQVLKTPEYSGLGVYSPDPDSAGPPTDFGLEKSNAELLRAISDLKIRYVHGNMSFDSHQPDCFNCAIPHPLQPDVLVVPDWPTNIAYEATTPAEQTRMYNEQYTRGNGDLSYAQIIEAEAAIALNHLAGGSAYAHTVHQGNLHVYSAGRSLTFDWLEAVLTSYEAYFEVPIKTPDWLTLAHYVEARSAHSAELEHGEDAVWNRTTGEVTYTPSTNAPVFFTGLRTETASAADQPDGSHADLELDWAETYGTDTVSRVGMVAGETVTLSARSAP